MIYIACPYTHPSAITRAERSRKAGKAMLTLAEQGILAVSPIFYGHSIEEKFHITLPYDYWMQWSFDLMSKCSSLYVVTIPGWRESAGVRRECELADQLGVPITGYCSAADAEEVSGLDIRREFGLSIQKAKGLRRIS